MSGPGKVRGWSHLRKTDDRIDTKWVEASLLLYNFYIDSPKLKTEHTDFLDKQVAIYLTLNPGARISLRGTASSTGTREYDRDLSKKRQDAVIDFLFSKGVPLAQIESTVPAAGKDFWGRWAPPVREDE